MDSKEALKKLADKFKVLEIKDKETSQVLHDNRERELKKVYALKNNVEDCKIADDEDPEKVEE